MIQKLKGNEKKVTLLARDIFNETEAKNNKHPKRGRGSRNGGRHMPLGVEFRLERRV